MFLRVYRALGQGYHMRGSEGSWSPRNVVGPVPGPLGSGPFQALHYAGFLGLLEPKERNRTLEGSSVSRAFPGPEPGHLKVPSYVCRESSSKLEDAVGFVGGLLEEPTSLRSLEDTRDGLGGIEAPKALPVCVSSAFVS